MPPDESWQFAAQAASVGASPKCGGSFNNNTRNVRAAVRNRNNNVNNNNGFRVALAHTSPFSMLRRNAKTPANIPPVVLSAHGRQTRQIKRDGWLRPWLTRLAEAEYKKVPAVPVTPKR
jgi:hypothetical protein